MFEPENGAARPHTRPRPAPAPNEMAVAIAAAIVAWLFSTGLVLALGLHGSHPTNGVNACTLVAGVAGFYLRRWHLAQRRRQARCSR